MNAVAELITPGEREEEALERLIRCAGAFGLLVLELQKSRDAKGLEALIAGAVGGAVDFRVVVGGLTSPRPHAQLVAVLESGEERVIGTVHGRAVGAGGNAGGNLSRDVH